MSSDNLRRAIGKLISVTADRFVVEMHAGIDNFTVVGFDDVHYVARLGSFLMIPVQTEYVVVEVAGLRERDIAGSDRDEGDLDRAASAKYLDVVPVGMLPQAQDAKFRFGVSVFPSLYADVLYALDAELDRVFETGKLLYGDDPQIPVKSTKYNVLPIGQSVIFEGYEVKVRIDDFFGGHTAVLGNTGSGKSCTVASILQSLFGKPDEYYARGATFVILDVNGEYAQALKPFARKNKIGVSHIILDGTASKGRFQLPHWFLEQSEWELLLQASEKTQVPILRTALGLTGLFGGNPNEQHLLEIKEHFMASCILECFRGADGDSPVTKFQRVVSLLQKYSTDNLNVELLDKYGANYQYGNFSSSENLKLFLDEVRQRLRQDIELPVYGQKPFTFDDLGECLDLAILYEEAHGNRQIRNHCSQMITRFKSLRERGEYAFIRSDPKNTASLSAFYKHLLGLIQKEQKYLKCKQIIIIDMNAIEDEIVELVSSVLARMIFRLLRQAEPRNRFPVHLLLEEAHRYIAERPSKYAIDASQVYERIAKEGRKYGVFLLVASQRPSELSKTVLSQCSNFVIHRIQNPDDLLQIRQMTPFISDVVLKRLPSLPKQHALIFGTAVNLPMTFKIRDANPLPKSDDAKIGDLWFHEAEKSAEIKVP